MHHAKLLPVFCTALALTACGGDFDSRLRKEAADYTEHHCPRPLDDFTRLDSVAYNPGARTYSNFLSVPDSLAAALRQNEAQLRAMLVGDLCADVGKKRCKDEKINFRYVYSGTNSKTPFLEVTLTPADYGM